MNEKRSILELLLRGETPNVRKSLPTARYRVKRLSELLGEDVVFELRALPYGKVSELKESMSEDLSVHIVGGGLTGPEGPCAPGQIRRSHAGGDGKGAAAAGGDRGPEPGGGAAVRIPDGDH